MQADAHQRPSEAINRMSAGSAASIPYCRFMRLRRRVGSYLSAATAPIAPGRTSRSVMMAVQITATSPNCRLICVLDQSVCWATNPLRRPSMLAGQSPTWHLGAVQAQRR